jgi:methylated-DNA-protein-cysteine methyltransferase-like protein
MTARRRHDQAGSPEKAVIVSSAKAVIVSRLQEKAGSKRRLIRMQNTSGTGSTVNEFHSKVYDIVAAIPEGRVLTYGQIALLLGEPKRARHVGRALSVAPMDRALPCHRVVNARGELSAPEIFGVGVQRAKLESEGIPFREDGRIDMKRLRDRVP